MAAAIELTIIPILLFVLAMGATLFSGVSTSTALLVALPVGVALWTFVALARAERREDMTSELDEPQE